MTFFSKTTEKTAMKPPKNYHGLAFDFPSVDPRQALWQRQRNERGFDDTETWNLFWVFADYIHPRLQALRDTTDHYPVEMGSLDEWKATLDKMIVGFKSWTDDEMPDSPGLPREKRSHARREPCGGRSRPLSTHAARGGA